jgi:hypothetical protein
MGMRRALPKRADADTRRARRPGGVGDRRLRATTAIVVLLVAAGGALVVWVLPVAWGVGLTRLAAATVRWLRVHWLSAVGITAAATVAAAILPVLLVWWQRRSAQQDRQVAQVRRQELETRTRRTGWEAVSRASLTFWPLPAVAEVDPYELGVFWSRRAEQYRGDATRPPYMERAADSQLRRLLAAQRLVRGQSRSGKSRTAFEAAAATLPGHRLVVPRDRAALTGLAEAHPPLWQDAPAVVWLDDLERYLAAEAVAGLDTALLTRWLHSPTPVTVVQAAVDWRRAGLEQPITTSDLFDLAASYLRALQPLQTATAVELSAGLEWATEPVGRTAALLVEDAATQGVFHAADPIIDHVERRTGRRLPLGGVGGDLGLCRPAAAGARGVCRRRTRSPARRATSLQHPLPTMTTLAWCCGQPGAWPHSRSARTGWCGAR